MNFQERFKGKTSTISKEGIESVVASSNNPIKKESSSYSNSHYSQQFTPLGSNSNNPTTLAHSHPPLLSLTSTAPMKSSHQNNKGSSQAVTPTNYNRTPGAKSFQNTGSLRSSVQLDKASIYAFNEELPVIRQSVYRGRPALSRDFDTSILKGGNQGHEPLITDSSPTHFNPNNFYNQHSQITTPQIALKVNRDMQGTTGMTSGGFKVNTNYQHKQNFENLTQQNKQRQGSREFIKDLCNPNYSQKYQGEENYRSPRINENFNGEYPRSQSPVKSTFTAASHQMINDDINRNPSPIQMGRQSPTKGSYNGNQNSQVIILNRLRYRGSEQIERSDNRLGSQDRDERMDQREQMGGNLTPISRRSMNNSPFNPTNRSYTMKPRSIDFTIMPKNDMIWKLERSGTIVRE